MAISHELLEYHLDNVPKLFTLPGGPNIVTMLTYPNCFLDSSHSYKFSFNDTNGYEWNVSRGRFNYERNSVLTYCNLIHYDNPLIYRSFDVAIGRKNPVEHLSECREVNVQDELGWKARFYAKFEYDNVGIFLPGNSNKLVDTSSAPTFYEVNIEMKDGEKLDIYFSTKRGKGVMVCFVDKSPRFPNEAEKRLFDLHPQIIGKSDTSMITVAGLLKEKSRDMVWPPRTTKHFIPFPSEIKI